MFIPIQKRQHKQFSITSLQKGGPGSGRYPAGSGGNEPPKDPMQASTKEELNELVNQDARYRAALETNKARGDARNDPGVLDSTGHYTVEAHIENLNITNSLLNDKARMPFGQKPDAVLMLGKPGSGKSTLRNNLGLTDKYSIIDADAVMEKLPGYNPTLAGAYHERAADIAEKYMFRQAVGQNMNIVYDATGKSAFKMLDIADSLKELGYNIHVVHASLSDLDAGKRVYSRWKSGGRLVPVSFATNAFEDRPSRTFNLLKEHYAQTAREYDTSTRQQLAKSVRKVRRYGRQLGERGGRWPERIGGRETPIGKYSPDQPRDYHGRFGTGGSVVFEVAPNPDDVQASEKWNGLSDDEKLSRSQDVADKIVPQILAAKGIKGGVVRAQIGSYQDDTNRSFTLELPDGSDPTSVVSATKTLGYNLSQKSMMTVADEPFPGSSPVDAITIESTKEFTFQNAKNVYDGLRGIKVGDKNAVNGQTTVGKQMTILNFPEDDGLPPVMDTKSLVAAIEEKVTEPGCTIHVEQVHSWLASKEKDYGKGYQDNLAQAGGMGQQPVSESSRDFRGDVTRAITKIWKFLAGLYPGTSPQQDGPQEAVKHWRDDADLVNEILAVEKVGPTLSAVHVNTPSNSSNPKKRKKFSLAYLQKRTVVTIKKASQTPWYVRTILKGSSPKKFNFHKKKTHSVGEAFRKLHAQYEPLVAKAFTQTVHTIQKEIPMDELIQAVEHRNIHAIVNLTVGDKFEKLLSGDFKRLIFQAYHEGGVVGAGQLRNAPVRKGGPGSGPKFTGRNLKARDVFQDILATTRAQEGTGHPAIRHDATGQVFTGRDDEFHSDIISRVSDDHFGGDADFHDFTEGFMNRGGGFIARSALDRRMLIGKAVVFKAATFQGNLNITNPDAMDYLANELPTLISEISQEQMQAVQQILLDGINSDDDGPAIARRIKSVVGLTAKQAQWVDNFRTQLEEGQDFGFTPIAERRLSATDRQMAQDEFDSPTTDAGTVDMLVDSYAASLTAKRAMDISVTETHNAFIQGQHSLWMKAKDLGYLDPDITRRHWLAVGDDVTRQDHMDAMNNNEPDGVGLDEPFDTPFGDVMNPGDSGDDSEDDNCRCTVFLTFADQWGSGNLKPAEDETDEEDDDAATE